LNRIRIWLVVVVALATMVLAVPSASARNLEVAACGTRIDIGVTVFSGGRVKGSGSYTSQSCRPISSVYLVIVENGRERASTKVTKYPPEPSSLKFSPKDFVCIVHNAHSFKTKIKATFNDGDWESKYSNTITVPCG
jgi:hypothetical protein